MSLLYLILIILGVAAAGYFAGAQRASQVAKRDGKQLHSLPGYHAQMVALFSAVPALFLIVVWLLVQPLLIENKVADMIPQDLVPEGSSKQIIMIDVQRIAEGVNTLLDNDYLSQNDFSSLDQSLSKVAKGLAEERVALSTTVTLPLLEAAVVYRDSFNSSRMFMTIFALAMTLGLAAFAYLRIKPDLRARNTSEFFIKGILIACSSVAILTTAGILFSLVFETFTFFGMYPASDFFFSTVWNPQFSGGSDLGLFPLLWGTLYVSFIALLVAVPIGLMIAIYLAEYATPRVRSYAKPAIEILAGIPTIVYGLFALITVGPFLRDYFAEPMGLGTSSSSVLTAGLVMGIMLIPFVSSLSDDIINAVPQSLRDGAYGLGATKSETIKQVIMPAALPGVVGAVLLAASRAIGETMIVVMGAGAAAKLSLNPLEAMTTITVKIVSQLTGDMEFASPETLVAFALGLTLFVFTLCLNILALYIVRKYREQYD